MKRYSACVITFAACAAVPMTVAAQSSVTIYGRIDTSIDRVKTGSVSSTQMTGNASRLGFRGVEDLGDGLKVQFGLEMGVSSDTGGLSTPAFRNSYVGLAGGFGAVAIGRLDSATPTRTPLYALVTRHTEFVIHDAGATAVGTSILNARTRESNAVGYASPIVNNFVFRAGYYLNGDGITEAANTPVRFESDYKQADVSLSYGEGSGPLGLGVGYGQNKKRGGALVNDVKDKWMAVASYDFGAVRAWALFNRDNTQGGPTSRSKTDVHYVGASWDLGNGKVVGNYMTKDVQTNRDAKLRRFQVGYLYNLSKRTNVYVFLDRSDPNNRVANDVVRAAGVGIQHNF
ncbi:porin [Paracidovorax anthurii]|uniref:Putative porin n=1 Tax=Paracidovorax anthurii TaxID=78229 RepID=A0A328ZFZ7_9BURK|nr:porin [Paracidovorax anthurii]RAR85240.1 putative porin [Paracidovorax anthurii]